MFGLYTDSGRPRAGLPGGWAAAALAVSLAVHAGAVVWVARSRVTIKVLRAAPEVRDVLLVPKLPSEKLTLPKAVGRAAAQPAVSAQGGPAPDEYAADGASDASGAGAGPRTTSTAPVPMVRPEGSGPAPSPLPEIRLHLGSASEPRGTSDFILVLPSPDAKTPASPPSARTGGKEVEDLLAYLYPELPGGGGGRRTGRGRSGATGRASGGATAGAYLSVKDPALIAWAGAALSLIMTHWDLPQDVRTTERIRAEITAVILSSGDVTSFHILSSSRNIPFDQAALEALRASAPFPAFPESLPYGSIEIRFLFENND